VNRTRVQLRIFLALVFGLIAILFVLLGVFVSVVAILVAVPFLLAAIILGHQTLSARGRWYYRQRGTDTRHARASHGGRSRSRRSQRREPQASGPSGHLTEAEARAVLEVPPDASEAAVRRAYRDQLKEVHPDQGGDEERFQRVTRAYDRLSQDETAAAK
jgi:hypothetical protein